MPDALTKESLGVLLGCAGLTLTEAQQADLLEAAPVVAAMVERNRRSRPIGAEPANIFVPGEGDAP